uniref:Peptidase S1 domain-containing protein n=1 Tax=Cyanoderma ruficeps TaxID=181631 RepID=A0A8C3QJL5_9PASS
MEPAHRQGPRVSLQRSLMGMHSTDAPFLSLSAYIILTFPISLAARIIGGREVKPHSRPYMAYLIIQNGSKPFFSCGGFLIRPDAVLSAAHCLLAFHGRKLRITVILGAHNIRGRERSQQKFRVRQWVIHPKYSRDGFKNDIVLLKLKPKARINKNVQLISIPRRMERVIVGTKCEVAGWGWTSVPGHTTNVMREVELKVQKEEICQNLFKNYQRQSMICVGGDSSKKGDSGGPLICKKKAHGIVSHGRERHPSPEVYTNISYFEPWIREQLRKGHSPGPFVPGRPPGAAALRGAAQAG